jgi:hypothetical protein
MEQKSEASLQPWFMLTANLMRLPAVKGATCRSEALGIVNGARQRRQGSQNGGDAGHRNPRRRGAGRSAEKQTFPESPSVRFF